MNVLKQQNPFFHRVCEASLTDWPFFDLKKALPVKQKSTG